MVKQLIIYGREGCPYCVKAKELANKFVASGSVEEVVYNDQAETNWTKADVANKFNISEDVINTVPQIGVYKVNEDGVGYIEYIGGYNQLVISDLYSA